MAALIWITERRYRVPRMTSWCRRIATLWTVSDSDPSERHTTGQPGQLTSKVPVTGCAFAPPPEWAKVSLSSTNVAVPDTVSPSMVNSSTWLSPGSTPDISAVARPLVPNDVVG